MKLIHLLKELQFYFSFANCLISRHDKNAILLLKCKYTNVVVHISRATEGRITESHLRYGGGAFTTRVYIKSHTYTLTT